MYTKETIAHTKLEDHIEYKDGWKTVCVAACLSYIGIPKSRYKYTESDKNGWEWENTLKKNGFKVRSKESMLGVLPEVTTLSELRGRIKRNKRYNENDKFLVLCTHKNEKDDMHIVLVNGKGEKVIDTDPGGRWKVYNIKKVDKIIF